jgi:Protein of unknown function (DUF3147)
MPIKVDFSTLRQTQWHDYAVRFLFGGLITAFAGIIAKKFGPGIGGLFLAFPAIFPASATLIEKHEKDKKESLGLKGAAREGTQPVSMLRAHPWGASGCLFLRLSFGNSCREIARGSFWGRHTALAGNLGCSLASSKGTLGRNRKYCFRIEILARQMGLI